MLKGYFTFNRVSSYLAAGNLNSNEIETLFLGAPASCPARSHSDLNSLYFDELARTKSRLPARCRRSQVYRHILTG
jgi:hypothetical protein